MKKKISKTLKEKNRGKGKEKEKVQWRETVVSIRYTSKYTNNHCHCEWFKSTN